MFRVSKPQSARPCPPGPLSPSAAALGLTPSALEGVSGLAGSLLLPCLFALQLHAPTNLSLENSEGPFAVEDYGCSSYQSR